MCRGRDPIFNPKFLFRCISFSQTANIFRSRASPFLVARPILHICRSRDHRFQNFFTCKPLLYIFFYYHVTLYLYSSRVSNINSGDPYFHARASSGTPSPIFCLLCDGTYVTTLSWYTAYRRTFRSSPLKIKFRYRVRSPPLSTLRGRGGGQNVSLQLAQAYGGGRRLNCIE